MEMYNLEDLHVCRRKGARKNAFDVFLTNEITEDVKVIGTVEEVLRKIKNTSIDHEKEILDAIEGSGIRYVLWRDDVLIDAGSAGEVVDSFDEELSKLNSVGATTPDVLSFSVCRPDGYPAGKIYNAYYGVVFADATVTLSLYPLDEDGEPDTFDDPIWDACLSGEKFRVLTSERFPLFAEDTAYGLFDDLMKNCKTEFSKFAHESGYNCVDEVRGIWEKDGAKYILFESEHHSDTCGYGVSVL